MRHASTARGRGGGPAVNLLRDEGIRSRWIRLVQSSDEGGGLGPLTAKDSILRNLDKTRLCLQQGVCVAELNRMKMDDLQLR